MHRHRHVPLALTGAGVLCAGILASALTTSDPLWWQSCFSRLGALGDISSELFNLGAILAGAVIALSALPIAVRLQGSPGAGIRAQRAFSTLIPLLIMGLGLSILLVGALPLSFDRIAHERAANGAVASAAGLLIMHRAFLRGRSRILDRIGVAAAAILTLGIAGMIVGVLSLTAFEAVAFGVILSWLHTLEAHVKRRVPAPSRRYSANSQLRIVSPIWGTTRSGVTLKSAVGAAGRDLGIRSV